MEKESDNKSAGAVTEESNQPVCTPVIVADETGAEAEALYYTKDGRAQFGITPPSAFALSYPYPPLPSNLSKNRVLRALDEQTKESVQEGITEAEKEHEKEAMPLPSLTLQGSPLPKVLIPEIELAIYWDRHPYEFRVPEKGQLAKPNGPNGNNNNNNTASSMRRSKSEMNLASKVGKLLEEYSAAAENTNSRRSSVSASNKTIRSTTVTNESNELLSPRNGHYGEHLTFPTNANSPNNLSGNGNRCTKEKGASSSVSRRNSATSSDSGKKLSNNETGKLPRSLGKNSSGENAEQSMLQMSESERKKFEDIKLFHHPNERRSLGQGSHSRPKLVRSQEQLKSSSKKSAGVQVTIDDVAAAALKSTYLCPLHGQYKRGIERRDKGGFRTDMSSVSNVHAHCSRALKGKPSRTKMIKTTETQTDGEGQGSVQYQSGDSRTNKRSKTAGNARNPQKGKDIMASEYHGSFRDPYKIAESEKRLLRNKILNYCFTKHSIF